MGSRQPPIVDDVAHVGPASVGLRETFHDRAGCARDAAGQYHAPMKSIVAALAVLLLSSFPPAAQTLEADMRAAAAAYERKDMATAVRIWKVWAGRGNAEARTLLGAMYWSGDGVPRNHKEAARLYLEAAKQGYARAQNDIGFMLGFGEGIPPPDDVEAYKWLSLAIANYTAKNQDRLDQARKDLAALAKRMTAAQIAEAERRAKAFKPVP
jgi:TPR repeat protein